VVEVMPCSHKSQSWTVTHSIWTLWRI